MSMDSVNESTFLSVLRDHLASGQHNEDDIWEAAEERLVELLNDAHDAGRDIGAANMTLEDIG